MKNKILTTILMLCISTFLFPQDIIKEQKRMQWFKDAKFGLFLHWGLFSVTAGDWKNKPAKGYEHFMLYERIPWKEYAKIANDFNPVKYDADKIVREAKNAGMKYIVITAKHHDGFAMYNSKSSDYNIVKTTPYHKDPMIDLAKACKKYGLKLCFYYSLGRDWQDPDVPTNWPVKAGRSNTWDYPNEDAKKFSAYFERKVKPQVRELLTHYGPIGILWFDTPELIDKSESEELFNMIREIQPDCIINSRIGNGFGDYEVAEQKITPVAVSKPWEACITMSRNWGYNRYDSFYKSPELLVSHLIDVVSTGGNLLLNIGPKPNGELPQQSIERLEKIGKWLKDNGEAIFGTKPWKSTSNILSELEGKDTSAATMKDAINDATSKMKNTDIRFTSKGDDIFVFLRDWKQSRINIRAMSLSKIKIKSIELLGRSKIKVKWVQNQDSLIINIPQKPGYKIPILVFKVRLRF